MLRVFLHHNLNQYYLKLLITQFYFALQLLTCYCVTFSSHLYYFAKKNSFIPEWLALTGVGEWLATLLIILASCNRCSTSVGDKTSHLGL